MRLIGLAVMLTLSLTLAPLAGEAQQQTGKIWRIGVLSPGAPGHSAPLEAFRQGLRGLGYIEGRNAIIHERFAEDRTDRLTVLARDLVQAGVDVIFAINTPAALAAKKATATIPIVVTRVSDPIGAGLVASLAHPGGNVTGLTTVSPELSGKRLELLHEALPRVQRIVKRTEGDLHIVEIGAHQVEDVGHCLKAGVNFVVESIETLPDAEELLLR